MGLAFCEGRQYSKKSDNVSMKIFKILKWDPITEGQIMRKNPN